MLSESLLLRGIIQVIESVDAVASRSGEIGCVWASDVVSHVVGKKKEKEKKKKKKGMKRGVCVVEIVLGLSKDSDGDFCRTRGGMIRLFV